MLGTWSSNVINVSHERGKTEIFALYTVFALSTPTITIFAHSTHSLRTIYARLRTLSALLDTLYIVSALLLHFL